MSEFRNTMMRMNRWIAPCLIGMAIAAGQAEAAGFAQRDLSASAAGAANAVVAGADDVSAAAYNPAGIAWQDGLQGMASLTVPYRHSTVDIGSSLVSNMGNVSDMTYLYGSWMPHESDYGLSLAYNRPYEMDNKWSNAFPASGQTVFSADRFSIDGIYRIGSNMSVAAGVDWYLANATVIRPGFSFMGSNNSAISAHLSGKWKPVPHWSVGFMARKGTRVTIDGGSGKSLDVTLPDEFTGGIAYDLFDAVRLELDGSLTRWSALKNLDITNGSTVVQANRVRLHDSGAIMAGATWFWRERTTLRFGYTYDLGAVNRVRYNPTITDQTSHKLSLGLGGDIMNVHGDFTFFYAYTPIMKATGSYAGGYKHINYAFMYAISKRF